MTPNTPQRILFIDRTTSKLTPSRRFASSLAYFAGWPFYARRQTSDS